MREITTSGLPIWFDEKTNRLEFRDGLTVDSDGGKQAGQMKGLLYDEEALNETEHCYDFYRDIVFEQHRELFKKYDFRYDITVIMPGEVNGECKKTSGHYHGSIPGEAYACPEVYEVLAGEAMYVMQKVKSIDDPDSELEIEDIKVVHVKAGEAVIIPPFWGHCSVNVGEGALVFSNIAVVACPLYYEPIKAKHGLSVYTLRENGKIKLVKNPNYQSAPEFKVVRPKQNPELGITFGKPSYQAFIKSPEKFDFLLHPDTYIDQMEAML